MSRTVPPVTEFQAVRLRHRPTAKSDGDLPVAALAVTPRRLLAVTPEPMRIHRQALEQMPELDEYPVILTSTLEELSVAMIDDDATRTHTGRLVRTVEGDGSSPSGKRFRCYRVP